MRFRPAFLPLAVALAAGACSDDRSVCGPGPRPPAGYPAVILPLPRQALDDRLARFRESNPEVCVAMDPFGVPMLPFDCPAPTGPGTPDSAAATRTATEFLERNREFFYLSDSLPRVARIERFGESGWRLRFAPQTVGGAEVHGTEILIEVWDGVWRTGGGHLPGVRVPGSAALSERQARSRLAREIQYPCWTPIRSRLSAQSTRVIFPLRIPDPERPAKIELRATYRFTYVAASNPDMAIEDVYLDAMTGEIVAVIGHIVC